MKTKLLALAVVLMLFCGAAAANSIVCKTVLNTPTSAGLAPTVLAGTAQVLNALGSDALYNDGCYQGDIFFTFNPTSYQANGAGLLTPDQVDVTVHGTVGTSANILLSGDSLNWSAADGGFTLSFSAETCTVALCGFVNKDIFNAAGVEIGPSLETGAMNYMIAGVGDGTYNGIIGPYPDLSHTNFLSNVTQINYTDTYTPAGSGFISSVQNDAYEFLLPEPGTMLLMGGALVGLAAALRKRSKSA